MTRSCRVAAGMLGLLLIAPGSRLDAEGPPGVTSLTNPRVRYTRPQAHSVTLRRGPVTAVIVDNEPLDGGHRAGYNGIASLTHERRPENLFVPAYAGSNLEHIFDGTVVDQDRAFEPRRAPMELRSIDAHTVELYQPPTPTWKLESCTRFAIEPDGVITRTFECIPRAPTFHNGYIGLFWASYIQQPESGAIYFRSTTGGSLQWVESVSPAHGVAATHLSYQDTRELARAPDYPQTLIFNTSKWRYIYPFYYGLSHGMAYVQLFRDSDLVRFSQSPSGGGGGNPAWDFQWVIPAYEVGKSYGFQMRIAYTPFVNPAEIEDSADALGVVWSEHPAFAPVVERPGLPRVLLIGDSISAGYTAPTRRFLQGKANVYRVMTNAKDTERGLRRLADWLGDKPWDVIHFNWGLHDLKRVESPDPAVPIDRYQANLRELVHRLKGTGAELIWATTTPIPDVELGTPRKTRDGIAYNAVARKIMEESGVAVDDLYAFALPRLSAIQQPADVHFTDAGSDELARQVAASIEAALTRRKARRQ